MHDKFSVDREILGGILTNELIPDEIKKILIITYIPTFKPIGAIANFNLENPEEARIAHDIFLATSRKALEEKTSIIQNSSSMPAPRKIAVLDKIISLAEGFEYSSKLRNEQDFSFITPPIYTDSLNEINRDMPIIKSLCGELLESYKKFYPK